MTKNQNEIKPEHILRSGQKRQDISRGRELTHFPFALLTWPNFLSLGSATCGKLI